MKKGFAIIIALVLVIGMLTGCATKPVETPSEVLIVEEPEQLTIGLLQLMDHTSLDEIRESFMEKVGSTATEKDIEIRVIYKNAQGDMSLIQSICRGFVEDEVDVIVAIATPSAQGALVATTEIPIIFSAVTDPVATKLLKNIDAPEGNITGVSDAIDVEKIFALAEEFTPEAKNFGIIYNAGEINSVTVVDRAKELLDNNGLEYTILTASNSVEAIQAARTLSEKCDAFFLPIDNTVASVMPAIAEKALENDIPVYVAADSMVTDGGFATVGINYTELGQKTAEMTIKVLTGTKISDLPVEVMDEATPVFNQETADALGIDISKYVK